MATPKTKPESKRKRVNVAVRGDLWREFRLALFKGDINVTEGIEQAIEVWLAHENSE